MPKRIQRKRTKGWRMPEGAVYVGKPTIWGNPWTIAEASKLFIPRFCADVCVREFRAWLEHRSYTDAKRQFPVYEKLDKQRDELLRRIPELRDKDLVCWCPLDKACHADVLIELANN